MHKTIFLAILLIASMTMARSIAIVNRPEKIYENKNAILVMRDSKIVNGLKDVEYTLINRSLGLKNVRLMPSIDRPVRGPIDAYRYITAPGLHTLSSDISSCSNNIGIYINASDVILDGKGHSIGGIGGVYTTGIYLDNVKNVTIFNVSIRDWFWAIYANSSFVVNISHVSTDSNEYGVRLENINETQIFDSNMSKNWKTGIFFKYAENVSIFNIRIRTCGDHGIELDICENINISEADFDDVDDFAIVLNKTNNSFFDNISMIKCGVVAYHSFDNIFTDTTVNNKPLIYLENEADRTIYDAGEVIAINCRNITVSGISFINTSLAVEFYNVNQSRIIQNYVKDNTAAFAFGYANSIEISGNNMQDNEFGIYCNYSNMIVTDSNTFYNNIYCGAMFANSSQIIIRNSYFNNNSIGIAYYSTENSIIQDNDIDSSLIGIGIHLSSKAIISNNILENNYGGIGFSYSNNNTIVNNEISGGFLSIGLNYSTWNAISQNTISYATYGGLLLNISSYNEIIDNSFYRCGMGVFLSYNNTVDSNTVNNKPIVYLENQNNEIIENAGQVIAVKCENITVRNSNLSYSSIGVEFQETHNSKIRNNTIEGNTYGIGLVASNNNEIFNNRIIDSSLSGIAISSANNSRIYLNTLINDVNVDIDDSTGNIFASPQRIEYTYMGISHYGYMGNYWSDYNGTDGNNDGIGDTPYMGIDPYPLIREVSMYFKPQILSYSPTEKNLQIEENQYIMFRISLLDAATITWYKNNTQLKTDTSKKVSELNFTANKGIWNLTAIITNNVGSREISWNITIVGPPIIINKYPNTTEINAYINDQISFEIILDEESNITWYKNASQIKTDINSDQSQITITVESNTNITVIAANQYGYTKNTWIIASEPKNELISSDFTIVLVVAVVLIAAIAIIVVLRKRRSRKETT